MVSGTRGPSISLVRQRLSEVLTLRRVYFGLHPPTNSGCVVLCRYLYLVFIIWLWVITNGTILG